MIASTQPMYAASGVRSGRLARKAGSSLAADQGRLGLERDPLRIALFVLTVITISRVHQHYPALEKARPALLLVVASIGYAYLYPRYLTRENVVRFWPMRLIITLGVLACGSVVFGISLGGAALFILNSYVKTLACAFLLAVSIRHVRDLYTFVWAYVVSCGILAYFSIFVFGITKNAGTYVTRLNGLYTYDSNDLCVVLLVGLPLNLLLLSLARGKKRWLLALILIGISATMARSGSRGGFLGLIAVGVAALLLVNGVSASRRVLVLFSAVIALLVAAPPGYWQQMETILKPKEDYNYTDIDGRKAVMKRGFGYMMQYPVFGLGINNFFRAECTISPKLATLRPNGPMRCTAPHNSYVESGAELGVPGLVVWSSLVFFSILAPLRLRRRLPRSWLRGTETERFLYGATSFFAVSMVGFAVSSFFVTFAWMDPVYVMAALLTGLYVSVKGYLKARDDSLEVSASALVSPRPVAGWRVAQSAWRSTMARRGRTG